MKNRFPSGLAAILLLLMAAADVCWGLRFAHIPITVDTEILIVGQPSKLTCDYVKFRFETVREIKWFAGYNGMKMKMFSHNIGTGEKEGSAISFIETEKATDTSLTVTLTEFREPQMTIGCEIQVLRDSGGTVRHSKKYKEQVVSVADVQNHQLVVKMGATSDNSPASMRKATLGRSLTTSCISRGTNPVASLTMTMNGEDISDKRGGRMDAEVFSDSRGLAKGVTAYLDTVAADDFDSSNLIVVECSAKINDHFLAKKKLVLRKDEGFETRPMRTQKSSRDWMHAPQQTPMARQGLNSEVIGSTLLEMLDPGRHVHPGIPYDFYSGYIVVVADHLASGQRVGRYRAPLPSTTLIGQLPHRVASALSREQRGRFEETDEEHTLKMKIPPVDVLNILGNLGYRVIGTSSPEAKQMVWTLELKDFEKFASHANGL